MATKPRTERSLLFPSKEFREKVREASKNRGFRSEQAFILAACESEIRRGDNDEAATQFGPGWQPRSPTWRSRARAFTRLPRHRLPSSMCY